MSAETREDRIRRIHMAVATLTADETWPHWLPDMKFLLEQVEGDMALRASEPPAPTEQFPAGSQGGGGFTDHMSFPKMASEPRREARAEMPTEPVTLAACPIGLFVSKGGELCLKTEYGNNEGRVDAYLVSSGEFFWGDPPQTIASQRIQLVRPVTEPGREARDAVLTAANIAICQFCHYAQHAVDCAVKFPAKGDCDCGLGDAMARMKRALKSSRGSEPNPAT